MMILKIFKYCH